MIPLGDASRRPLNFPVVTMLIIVTNVFVFVLELAGGDAFIMQWSVIPADIVAGRNWFTILTSMFMHAGWAHLLGNMLFLWVFGPQIEDVMGPARYLAFYVLGGLAATFAQIAVDPTSTVPNLGASGAIAAVMGAFLVTYPNDQIQTILVLGWFTRIAYVPALLLVGLWFVVQLFNGVGALAAVQTDGVAYMAHVGGFVFGAAAVRLFQDPRRLARQRWNGW